MTTTTPPELSLADLYVLRSLHANAREHVEVATRLAASGLRFCNQCDTCRPLSAFGRNGDWLQGFCRTCALNQYLPKRATSVASPARRADSHRRSQAKRPLAVRARKAVGCS